MIEKSKMKNDKSQSKSKKRKRQYGTQQKDNQETTMTTMTKKEKKEKKKRRHDEQSAAALPVASLPVAAAPAAAPAAVPAAGPAVTFDMQYIVAPMVGASELPFRLLCRKYGAQLCYTPMMLASDFVRSAAYRHQHFETNALDRPLVCHFAANSPKDFAAAAKLVAPYCDAVDLNLGCPQRTAYVGQFGSYLLDENNEDPTKRALVLAMIRAAVAAVRIPIFVKIRLLKSYAATLQLCHELYTAGATAIAVHGRYRASYHRHGPGARDGPALLEHIQQLRHDLFSPHTEAEAEAAGARRYPPNTKYLITNGNTITYDDVVANLELTQADGLMSAEGILDNPGLFLERFGPRISNSSNSNNNNNEAAAGTRSIHVDVKGGTLYHAWKKEEKYRNKLHEIATIETKLQRTILPNYIPSTKEQNKLSKKESWLKKLQKYEKGNCHIGDSSSSAASLATPLLTTKYASTQVPLQELYASSDDKVQLGYEYLRFVRQFPRTVPMRTVLFHIRRMLKEELVRYQLMADCLQCTTIEEVEATILAKVQRYREHPATFTFDSARAQHEKAALARKQREEGKRKEYEARMLRKAKREKLDDLEYYLRQGSTVPTWETIQELKQLKDNKPMKLQLWKERDHSQHCLAFHVGCSSSSASSSSLIPSTATDNVDRTTTTATKTTIDQDSACPRGRRCAFLHVIVSSPSTSAQTKNGCKSTDNSFEENEAVSG